VITAAGRLQGTLAGWVHQHGAWPWVVLLVVVAFGAVAGYLIQPRRRPHRSRTKMPSTTAANTTRNMSST
jgi:hypothetical protein